MFTSFWKQWDRAFYKTVYFDEESAGSKLSNNIRVVNIVKPELDSKTESLKAFRSKIISFLNTVENRVSSKEDPEAILFDISFSNDPTLLNELKEALVGVKEKGVDVYAVYNLRNYFEKIPVYEVNEANQAGILYDSIFKSGRLHSGFIVEDGLITYPSDIYLKGAFQDSIRIESIVKRVALDDKSTKIKPEFENLVTPLGPKEAMEKQRHEFSVNEKSDANLGVFDPIIEMDEKYILVGDLIHDFQHDISMPRTYFMAWALNEKIVDDKIAKQPLDHLGIIIGQTIFFSLFTVLIFALVFKYVKRLQTKPKLLAVLSFALGLLFLALYGALVFAFDKVIPIGLTLLGMVIAAVLCWRFAYKFLVTGIAEGSEKYDVFISYSHGNSDWVKKNVFEPLDAFRKPNGDKLNIFFDVKSIGIGEQFTSKYMWGIVDSKLFVPIMSEEYYGKNHCKNEMDLAYKRSVEKLLKIMPIAYTFECVPEIYTHVNVADITVNPNFMDGIKEELSKM